MNAIREKVLIPLANVNLFTDNASLNLTDQKKATRLYLLLLFISVLILVSFTSATGRTRTVVVPTPKQELFEQLARDYPSTLSCPCSQISIEYGRLIQFSPIYHQICYSHFVDYKWFSLLLPKSTNQFHILDFRLSAAAFFHVLSIFCQSAADMIRQQIEQFSVTLLVSSDAMFREEFNNDMSATAIRLGSRILTEFKTMNNLISSSMGDNDLFTGLRTSFYHARNPRTTYNLISAVVYSNTITRANETNQCDCGVSFKCSSPSGIYPKLFSPLKLELGIDTNVTPIFQIAGVRIGCVPFTSVLESTLECFYSQTCLEQVLTFMNISANRTVLKSDATSRFQANTTVNEILSEMMLEPLESKSNYSAYFSACAPATCTYSYLERFSIIYVATTVISLFGGLNIVARLLSPLLITNFRKLFGFLRNRKNKKIDTTNNTPSSQTNTTTPVTTPLLMKIKQLVTTYAVFIKQKVVELNLFKNKENNLQAEIFSTRVYIIFFSLSVLILTIYSATLLENVTYIVNDPTPEIFENLITRHPFTLSCPCTRLSIPYAEFTEVKSTHHQICSSTFISDNGWLKYWPLEGIGQWTSSIQVISVIDFRNMGASLFRLIQTYCNFTTETVIQATDVFKSMELVRSQPFSKEEISLQLTMTWDQYKKKVKGIKPLANS